MFQIQKVQFFLILILRNLISILISFNHLIHKWKIEHFLNRLRWMNFLFYHDRIWTLFISNTDHNRMSGTPKITRVLIAIECRYLGSQVYPLFNCRFYQPGVSDIAYNWARLTHNGTMNLGRFNISFFYSFWLTEKFNS